MSRIGRVSGVFAGAAVMVAVAAIGVVTAGANPAPAGSGQPSLVEDYTYPGADQIFAEFGVKLISGDGHLLFVKCSTKGSDEIGLIRVHTTDDVVKDPKGLLCFQVLGASGRLALKIPAVYEIRGDGLRQGKGHKLRANLTTDAGEHKAVDVDPSGPTSVGIGLNPNNAPTTLLQLDATS